MCRFSLRLRGEQRRLCDSLCTMSRRDKLPEILSAHALWLDTDGREGARANLSRVNLAGAKLAGARLQKANLRYAGLGGADFTGADLRGADLRGATLVVTVQGYNELDLPREYATADFTGAQLEGVLADVPLDRSKSNQAPAPAPPEIEEPEPDDASARWEISWPVTLERLEVLVRRAGGVLDPLLPEVSALMKVFDGPSERGGSSRVWQRTNNSCAISVRYSHESGEDWWASAQTRFGTVELSVSHRGPDAYAPLVIVLNGTPKEAEVLAALRAALEATK